MLIKDITEEDKLDEAVIKQTKPTYKLDPKLDKIVRQQIKEHHNLFERLKNA